MVCFYIDFLYERGRVMRKFIKPIVAITTVMFLILILPVISIAAVISADDLVGRWERFGDGAEGTIVTVKKVDNKYQATLETVTGTLSELSFSVGDLKWKDVKWTTGTNYTGTDMFRYVDGGYEYRYSELKINSSGILEVYVANSGDTEVIIGTYQTWRRLPTAWAVPEIQKAMEYGLTTDKVLKNYQGNITREEFAEISVKLYEALTGNTAQPVSPNPFKDTSNPEILKAYKLGIVNGITTDTFSSDSPATREQICLMLLRAIKAIEPEYIVDNSGVQAFADSKDISSWALEAVKQLNKLGVVNGVGGGKISPKGNTTREQAIAMIKRVYEKFAD